MEKSVKMSSNDRNNFKSNPYTTKHQSVDFKVRNLKTQLDKHPLNSSNFGKQLVSTDQSTTGPRNRLSIDNPNDMGISLPR